MAPHSSVLTQRTHGQRSLVGYSPRGRKESDTTGATEHARCPAQKEQAVSAAGSQRKPWGGGGPGCPDHHPKTAPPPLRLLWLSVSSSARKRETDQEKSEVLILTSHTEPFHYVTFLPIICSIYLGNHLQVDKSLAQPSFINDHHSGAVWELHFLPFMRSFSKYVPRSSSARNCQARGDRNPFPSRLTVPSERQMDIKHKCTSML